MADVNTQLNEVLSALQTDIDTLVADVEAKLRQEPPSVNIDAGLAKLAQMRAALQSLDAEVKAEPNPVPTPTSHR
jgi:hypothetical protein